MDIADKSFHDEQARIEETIKIARTPTAPRYKPVGHCLSCFKDLDSVKLFCDNICADEHERMRRLGRV